MAVLDVDFFYSGRFRKSGGVPLIKSSTGFCRCPSSYHEDKNPSAKLYEGGVYCFVCAKFFGLPYIAKVVGYQLAEGEEFERKSDLDEKVFVDSRPLFYFLDLW